uniref:Uncharacterized protein n=1 Tax=Fundidesulfovibrio putealis TaxID=270496 RepID=A0A7C4AHG2_9BACT
MSQDATTTRLTACLASLRRLKETSALREAMEREILLSVLLANRDRISEFPTLEGDQANLIAAVTGRAELLPAHQRYRDWMAHFLTALNQYDVAERTKAEDQAKALREQLANLETLLVKCLQGYILLAALIRDEFNDVILRHFGESALADIDELTHAGYSDDLYWKALFDRFVTGFIAKTYEDLLARDSFSLAREGSFVAARFPLDAFLSALPGTDKIIDKTRVQQAFEDAGASPQTRAVIQSIAAMLAGADPPLLPGRPGRADLELLGAMASLDPAAEGFVAGSGEAAQEGDAARQGFLRDQMLALATGAAMALGLVREDLTRALSGFTPKERENILAVIGAFDTNSLQAGWALMLEYALCALLAGRTEDEGGKVQVKSQRHRRAPRAKVEELAAHGFNRVRRKMFFEDDPAGGDWLLFKARSGQELAEALNMANMGPELSQGLTALWTRKEFKAEAVALVNLGLLAKTAPNLQAKLAEILTRLGLVKSGAPPA